MNTEHILTLLPNCPVKAQNAGLFISRGQGTHPTRVIESHELIFVRQGLLQMWEETRTFALGPGQTLHLWPSRRHGGVGTLPPGLEFYWIHFEIIDTDYDLPSPDMIQVPQVQQLGRPEKLESLFRFFLDSQEVGDLQPQSANLLMLLMLCEVAHAAKSETDDSDLANALAERAKNHIHMNYDRNITPGSVAQALGYNPDYLGRVYRHIYGCTLTEAIHRRRIKVACSYLLDSDMSIEEIAAACGFADADYFRRIFRRYMHITPTAYRNASSRVHVNTH